MYENTKNHKIPFFQGFVRHTTMSHATMTTACQAICSSSVTHEVASEVSSLMIRSGCCFSGGCLSSGYLGTSGSLALRGSLKLRGKVVSLRWVGLTGCTPSFSKPVGQPPKSSLLRYFDTTSVTLWYQTLANWWNVILTKVTNCSSQTFHSPHGISLDHFSTAQRQTYSEKNSFPWNEISVEMNHSQKSTFLVWHSLLSIFQPVWVRHSLNKSGAASLDLAQPVWVWSINVCATLHHTPRGWVWSRLVEPYSSMAQLWQVHLRWY